jgi:hypothetical protein
VITRYITLPMPVPGATIRAMPGDPGRLPALVSPAVPGAGTAVLPGEPPGRVREELPVIAAGEAEQVLVSGVGDRAAVGAHPPAPTRRCGSYPHFHRPGCPQFHRS